MNIGHHLYERKLGEAAEREIDQIITRLLKWDEWEERDDGIAEAAKKANVAEFENDITEVKKACKLVGNYAYGILRYKQPGPSPSLPSDRFRVLIPLEIQSGSNPQVKDKYFAHGWAIYTTQSETVSAGVTILWLRCPQDTDGRRPAAQEQSSQADTQTDRPTQ